MTPADSQALHIEHSHCPCDCEHPQPFEQDGVWYCGRCWVKFGALCLMIPCTPETCNE